MKPVIIIAGASSGWGHHQAAKNIATAVRCSEIGSAPQVIDVFSYLPYGTSFLFREGWRFASCHLGQFYDELYRRFISHDTASQLTSRVIHLAAERMRKDFSDRQVTVYIATHSIAAAIGSKLKEKLHFKLAVVATDFVLHSMQVFPNVDWYFLPPGCGFSFDQKTRTAVEPKIRFTGIPIACEFSMQKDKRFLRRKFGLSPNDLTILVSFGGSGLKAERHFALLDSLVALSSIQLLVLAGYNFKFAQVLRSRYRASITSGKIQVFDFLHDVSDFYSVADLFIGKAGGLSVSEALASNLPIGIIDTLPGQEGFNVKMLTDNGLGQDIRLAGAAQKWIRQFVDKGISPRCGKTFARFSRPKSSIEIAHYICEEFGFMTEQKRPVQMREYL